MKDFKEKLVEIKDLTLSKKRKKTINKLREKLGVPVEENPEFTLEAYVEEKYLKAERYIAELNEYLNDALDKGRPTILSKEEYISMGEFLLLYKARMFFANPQLENYYVIYLPTDFTDSTIYFTYEVQRQSIAEFIKNRPSSKYKSRVR